MNEQTTNVINKTNTMMNTANQTGIVSAERGRKTEAISLRLGVR